MEYFLYTGKKSGTIKKSRKIFFSSSLEHAATSHLELSPEFTISLAKRRNKFLNIHTN